MKPTPQKVKIRNYIIELFRMLKPDDQLRTDDIIRYVKRNTVKQNYPDTILRYARELRAEGKINYTSISKEERIIRIIPAGVPHSR